MSKAFTPELEKRIEPEFRRFMEHAERVRWSPADIDYKSIDRSRLSMGDLFAIYVTLHIENYSDVYTKLLLEHFADAPLTQSFIRNWEREEENHARALERYLLELGLTLEELKASYALVDKRDFPFPSNDQTGLNVFVFIQELMTREMYTKMLKAAREPVLIDILKRVVRDEERHYRFYRHALALRMELDRRDTLIQFRRIIGTFGMPKTMFAQKAMTDELMRHYRYEMSEIANIARPVFQMLEASSSPVLERFPKAQKAWKLRRAAAYVAASPYVWGHVRVSLKNKLAKGLPALKRHALLKNEKEHVQAVLERLQKLLPITAS